MPEISFYVLPSESAEQRLLFACKLLEKAYRSGYFCYVLTDSPEQSQRMDDLLWSFRAGSFVPHGIFDGTAPDLKASILIGTLAAPALWQDSLLNLSAQAPDNFQNANRLLEILDNSETCLSAGRQRYKLYKQAGFSPQSHTIAA